MRILLASSELHPYSKTGGLADMVGAMGKALAKAGHQVAVVTPLYRGIRGKVKDLHRVPWDFHLPMGKRWVNAELWATHPANGLTVYFIDKPEYYDRNSLYVENGADYPDNGERFIFFSKCITHLARYLPLQPEMVHLNDWQTGLVPVMIKHQALTGGWGNPPRTCLTIHNLAYQGVFPGATWELTNLPKDYFHRDGAEYYGRLNCMKAGLAFADGLTTVSPRYAREIMTEAFGEGLDWLLRKRQAKLFGILNGVDYDEWNPAKDELLEYPYSAKAFGGKAKDKALLQEEFGLPVKPKTPLFGTITRLTDQKGMDIQLGALEEMAHTDMQFVLLGGGSAHYERAYQKLASRFPDRIGVRIGFDLKLSHWIEAGCDFYLMPSRFEPCGLNQMYSLRYGTVPVVRVTGGLDDAVMDAAQNQRKANGIKFAEYTARALAKAMRKALLLYKDPKLLRMYRLNAMKSDFSWERTVKDYEMMYTLI